MATKKPAEAGNLDKNLDKVSRYLFSGGESGH